MFQAALKKIFVWRYLKRETVSSFSRVKFALGQVSVSASHRACRITQSGKVLFTCRWGNGEADDGQVGITAHEASGTVKAYTWQQTQGWLHLKAEPHGCSIMSK